MFVEKIQEYIRPRRGRTAPDTLYPEANNPCLRESKTHLKNANPFAGELLLHQFSANTLPIFRRVGE